MIIKAKYDMCVNILVYLIFIILSLSFVCFYKTATTSPRNI